MGTGLLHPETRSSSGSDSDAQHKAQAVSPSQIIKDLTELS